MAMKEFATAAQRAERAVSDPTNDTPPITTKVADREVTFWFPGTSQMAMFATLLASQADDLVIMGEAINWVLSLLQPDPSTLEDDDEREAEDEARRLRAEESHRYLRRMLLTKGNGFEADVLVDVAMYLFEEWSGKATAPRAGSSGSRSSTGATSTAASRRQGKPTR